MFPRRSKIASVTHCKVSYNLSHLLQSVPYIFIKHLTDELENEVALYVWYVMCAITSSHYEI